jgi:hypothetical protein
MDDPLPTQLMPPSECALPLQLVAIGNQPLDNELAEQVSMRPEDPLRLQLLAMCDHLIDEELAAQLLMPPECPHSLQYLADHELAAQSAKPQALAHLQIDSESRGQGTSLE